MFQTLYTLHLGSSLVLGMTWQIFVFLYRMNLAIWPRGIQNFILKVLNLLQIFAFLIWDRTASDRDPGYRSRGPGSIPGATRISEK
jgi:hypothetical protein